MATIIDNMLAANEGRTKMPKVIVGASSILSDPERPSFVAEREVARSQFEYLSRSLVGDGAPPPDRNPVWRGLMDAAVRIRTQQSTDATNQPVPAIPDEAVNRTALLTDVGIKRMALVDALDGLSPNKPARVAMLYATGQASLIAARRGQGQDQGVEADRTSRPGASNLAKTLESSPAAARNWETPEAKAIKAAVRDLAAVVPPDVARAVVREAAVEGVAKAPPSADARMQRDPQVAEAWDSAHGRGLRQAMAKMDEAQEQGGRSKLAGALLAAANEEGFSGRKPRPEDMAKTPGFKEAWDSPQAEGLRKSMDLLGRSVRQYIQQGVGAPSDQRIDAENVDARSTYDRWAAAAPSPSARSAPRWTDAYQVVMDDQHTARVTRDFIAMALKSHDVNHTPTKAELAKDIGVARDALAAPEKKLVADYRLVADPEGKGSNMAKIGMKEVTVRPPLVGNDPYASHMVGLEGQAYYGNVAAVADTLAKGGSRTTFVSFAAPDTNFRKTLVEAAERQNIPVLRGELNVSNRSMNVSNTRLMSHVDGAYAAEGTTVRVTERQLMVENPRFNEMVPLGSRDGRQSTRGALVIVDVQTPEKAEDRAARLAVGQGAKGDTPGRGSEAPLNFIARLNNGALTAPVMVAFGGTERGENNIFKMARRRELSGMSQPTFVDKNGVEMDRDKAALHVAQRGVTRADERAAEVAATRSWATSDTRAHLLVAAALPGSRDKQKALLDNYATLGDAVDAATAARNAPKGQRVPADPAAREALFAAAAYERATANPNRMAMSVEQVTRQVARAGEDVLDILADPRDKAVARTGAMMGFSTPQARSAPAGSRYAIIGDEKPVTPAMNDQIERVMSGLSKLHGRDEDGIARIRVATTLTPGVGEAVMRAGLKHGVPVEAYGSKDDRTFTKGTKDLELFALAANLKRQGLGGTWSLGDYDGAKDAGNASRERAARAAMDNSDAVVASRIDGKDPLKMVLASAGRDKPVMTLPAGRREDGAPDVRGWEGTAELAKPNTSMRAQIPADHRHDPSFTVSGASRSVVVINEQDAAGRLAPRRVVIASVDTGQGATEMRTTGDLKTLKAAASGEVDLRMGRPAPEVDGRAEASARTGPSAVVRWDVMENLDMGRFHDKSYRKDLDLTKDEDRLATKTYAKWKYTMALDRNYEPESSQEPKSEMGKLLSQRFKVTESAQVKQKARTGGMEV